jgi:hypothetical protein
LVERDLPKVDVASSNLVIRSECDEPHQLAPEQPPTSSLSSQPPTTVGGTWPLGPTSLAHAAAGPNRRYCLVFLRLDSGRPDGRYCAPPRNGLSRASITDGGTTLMRFDSHRPS